MNSEENDSVVCLLCEERVDSQAHIAACDINALTRARKRAGLSVGSVKIGDRIVPFPPR